MNRTALCCTTLAVPCLLGAAALLAAGPLTPPGGPVASTAKPLSEVEPRIAINATNTPGDPIGDASPSLFKITQPGSYYLTGNITGVVGKHGIEIAASGVTLDLNGFDLAGVAGMGAFDGVSVTVSSLTNIAVVNGSVRNWGDEGVDLGTFNAVSSRVEGVVASGNTGNGISTGNGCTVTNCSASGNTANGIGTGAGCTVSNCSASGNTAGGVSASSGCTVSNCSAYLNTGVGITTSFGCTVSNCSATSNTAGGISTASGCTVSSCTAFQNAANGISTGNGSSVVDCTARSNTGDGVVCSATCMIRGNTCALNGSGGDGAGIHATGAYNRIEGNSCTGADRGIDVDLSGNIIIRNTCAANITDWDIVANNIYGPIIDRSIPTPVASTPAAVGTSATSTLGSTDPNANFSY